MKAHLTGISLPIISGGVDWTVAERHVADRGVRNQIELLTDLLREHEAGLLITLDEVHRNQISDLRELATAVQHAFREERDVAFVAAGLQSSVSDLLNDDVLTFLRRADKHHLGKVAETDVVAALTEPIATAGKTVDEDALLPMVEGTGGYAFLIQLIGYHSWRSAVDKDAIAAADATVGVARAFRRLGSLVHEPALHNVSAVSKSFLVAMAKDNGPSKMGDIQERLGVTQVYASQYRLRLIDAELIEPAGHGHVDFSLPHMREYLREHAVSDL